MCVLTLLVFVGLRLKMVLLVTKNSPMCADPIIYCLVQEIHFFLFHQMIVLTTVVKKLFNSSHIHAFYIFSSRNFIAPLSSEKSSSKQISNRNFSKPSLTLLKDFMCVYIFMLCAVLFRLSKGSWRIMILLSCAQYGALYIQSHWGQLCSSSWDTNK